MKLIILLLAYVSLVRSQNKNSCPSSEDIKPCKCDLLTDDTPDVLCKNLKSADELLRRVTYMKNYFIRTFTLEKSNIGILPSDAFTDSEIEHLILKECNLTKLSEGRSRPPFVGLENSLLYLDILQSFQDGNSPLASLSLSHLKKLHTLVLSGNFISAIGNNWFENGPYNIKVLRIESANISVFGSHAFEALEKLENLSLKNGSVSTITREMLPMPAEFLVTIDLSYNKLNSLPADFFTKMPSLTHVYLHSNLLTTIDEVIWAPIWNQLEYVYFHGNPIVCDKELKWIYNYRLPEFYSGYCASPAKLRNKDLRKLNITDIQ